MRTSWWPVSVALCVAVAANSPCLAQDPAATPPSTPATTTPPRSAVAAEYEERPDPAEVAADVLVVRPVGLAATAIGAAIFVVALPFAAISGDINRAGKSLVGAPANFTFRRRLGDFESGGF